MPNAIRTDELSRFAGTLFEPGDALEIRGIKIERGGRHRSPVEHCLASELIEGSESMEAFLSRLNIPGWGVYVGANPRKRGQTSGRNGTCTDADVALARCLFADFDDCTPEEARGRVARLGGAVPVPTLYVASGGGVHAYWKLSEPFEGPEGLAEWEGFQRALAAALDSDSSIVNPSRVMRIPGTRNWKREGHPLVEIVSGGTFEAVHLSDFDITPIRREVHPADDAARSSGYDGLSRATYQYLATGAPEGERNSRTFAAACDMAGCGISEEEAARRISEVARRIGFPVAEAYAAIRSAYSRPRDPANPSGYDGGPENLAEAVRSLQAATGSPWDGGPGDVDPEDPDGLFPEGFSGQDPGGRSASTAEYTTPTGNPVPEDGSAGEAAAGPGRLVLEITENPAGQGPGYHYREARRSSISNVEIRTVVQADRREQVAIYKSVDQIAREIREACDGWPKRVGGGSLIGLRPGRDGERELWLLDRGEDLFAMLHDRAAVHWHTGEAFDPETLARRSPVTRSELFHWLKANCLPSVEAAYEYPHVPKLPKSYYLPRTYRRSHRSRLRELVDTFNADTPTDRGLLLAAILTCGWGGNPGTRPAYVLTSDYGQSSGKTATARVIGSIWGGAVPLDYSPQWTEVSKRIFSSDDYLSRVFLFDNIKGKSFGGTGIETAITSKRLSGHRMYVGTVSRPNDALWVITFNMPSLTRDMSERSVTVRIGKPQGGTDWLEWAEAFVENHREEILAEVFEILSQPAAVKVTGKDRWGVWHREVLGRITPDRFPGIPDGDALSKAVVARRGELDDEVEDRVGLLEAVASYLCASDRGPKGRDGGRVPLTYTEAARLIQDAGYWVPPRGDLAPNIEAREAVRAVEKSFMGTGILTKSKSKVRVDGRGVPTLAGAKQSRFWMLDWGVVKGLGVNPTSQGGGGLLPPR